MKKNETCIVITSYCNTEKKKKILFDNIIKIKNKLDIKILLHTNKISLDKEYQNEVDYYIYDNEIFNINKFIIPWIKTHNYKLKQTSLDFGYYVIHQVKSTLNYLLSLNYKYVIYINYDIVFSDEDINDINNFLKDDYNKDAMVYYRDNNNLNPILLMFNINKFKDYFNITIDDFKNYNSYESFLMNIFSNKNIDLLYRNIESSVDSMNGFNTCGNNVINIDNFKVFVYNRNNEVSLFLFEIKNKSDINLLINDNINHIKETDLIKWNESYYYIIHTNIIDDKIKIEYNDKVYIYGNIKNNTIEKL